MMRCTQVDNWLNISESSQCFNDSKKVVVFNDSKKVVVLCPFYTKHGLQNIEILTQVLKLNV